MPRSRTLPPSAAAVEESTVGDVTVLEYAEHALNHQKCALESAKSLASVVRTKVLGGLHDGTLHERHAPACAAAAAGGAS